MLPGPPCLFPCLPAEGESKVIVTACKFLGSDRTALLVELQGPDPDNLVRKLRTVASVRGTAPDETSGTGTLLVLLHLRDPIYCTIARVPGVVCITCPFNSVERGRCEWKILVTDSQALRSTVQLLRGHGIEASIRHVSDPEGHAGLTFRQRQVLLEAIEAGYFESPRRITLTSLSRRLSVAPPTLSEILRKAESKLARVYLQDIAKAPPTARPVTTQARGAILPDLRFAGFHFRKAKI